MGGMVIWATKESLVLHRLLDHTQASLEDVDDMGKIKASDND